MKRTLLLFLIMLIGVIFIVNSTKRILTFRETSQSVKKAQERLEKLREENKALKKELEYKKSEEFAEEEIRNKLGLVKEGEAIVILPRNDDDEQQKIEEAKPRKNWQKWWNLFFAAE